MIELPLTIRHESRAEGDAESTNPKVHAWFIPSAEPGVWLDEVRRLGVDQSAVRFHPIPRSKADRETIGVLVTAPDLGQPSQRGQPSPRCHPYTRVAGQVYLPVGARFDPALSTTEIERLFGTRVTAWHPTIGPVAFEYDETLTAADLLEPFDHSIECWDRAQPSVALNDRLLSIQPDVPPTVETIIEEARGDIGSEPLDDIPQQKTPSDIGPIGKAGRWIAIGAAYPLRWLTDLAPGGAANPTWIDKLGNWAGSMIESMRRDLHEARNKELNRLMQMLEDDPEQGLRYALPLGGDPGRGVAPPSDRLSSRDINFSLGNFGGGRPADYWDIEAETQRRLEAKYRELAAREVSLGNHRRAAYIYAQLLYDLHAAASTLAAGRHYREAAVLYKDRLHNPRAAAQCLEDGGLLADAADLYEEIGELEKAADLFTQINRIEHAHKLYRQHIDARLGRLDFLGAALVYEQKLEQPEAALDVLDRGWPDAPQATACLTESFALLRRMGRPKESATRVQALTDASLPIPKKVVVAEVLAKLFHAETDANVRGLAENGARIVASNVMTHSRENDQRMVKAVSALVPNDRLLHADGQRFLDQRSRRTAHSGPQQKKVRRKGPKPTLVRRVELPSWNWEAVTTCGDEIVLAGRQNNKLSIARVWTDGTVQKHQAGAVSPSASRLRLVGSRFNSDRTAWMYEVAGAEFSVTMPPVEGLADRLVLFTPSALTPGTFAITRPNNDQGAWTMDVSPEGFVFKQFNAQGHLTNTYKTTFTADMVSDISSMQTDDFELYRARREWLVGLGSVVWVVPSPDTAMRVQLAGEINHIEGNPQYNHIRAMVSHSMGAMIMWDDPAEPEFDVFQISDMPHAVATLSARKATLWLANETELRAYNVRRYRGENSVTVGLDDGKLPLAIKALDKRQLAIVYSDEVLFFESDLL